MKRRYDLVLSIYDDVSIIYIMLYERLIGPAVFSVLNGALVLKELGGVQ